MNRLLSQRTVAESRAPVFARPAQPASTPTGISNIKKKVETKESWPGPFATARDIISKREEAKRRRIEDPNNNDSSKSLLDDADEYDIILSKLQWTPSSNNTRDKPSCPTLSELCIKAYTTSFNITAEVISKLSDECKEKLLLEIAKSRAMTPSIALAFIVENSGIVSLPECSLISEHTFHEAFDKICPQSDFTDSNMVSSVSATTTNNKTVTSSIYEQGLNNDNDDEDVYMNSIKIIQLWNAGFGFSDKVAMSLLSKINTLEIFQVTGLYRLSDDMLSKLLLTCNSTLRYFDSTSNFRISHITMKSFNMNILVSLSLDYCTHLNDDHFVTLINSLSQMTSSRNEISTYVSSSSSSSSASSSSTVLSIRDHTAVSTSSLRYISLVGLINITDQTILNILQYLGYQLQSLNISQCTLLTDQSLVHIRTYCRHLHTLDISMIPLFTTSGLIGLFIQAQYRSIYDNNQYMIPQSAVDLEDDSDNKVEDNIDQNEDVIDVDNHIQPDSFNITPHDMIDDPMSSSSLLHESIGPLEDITLKCLDDVTDDVILHLCLSNTNRLKKININGCHKLTSKSFIILDTHARNTLEVIDMSFVRGISEQCTGYAVERCINLTELHVWGCTQLTSTFYQSIRPSITLVGKPSWIQYNRLSIV